MGFFSDLLDLAPHTTVGLQAKEFCINTGCNEKETALISELGIDRREYIKIRNSFHMKMFAELFHVLHQQHPNASFGIADAAFQVKVRDYYFSIPESERQNLDFSEKDWGERALWEDLADSFYQKITGKELREQDISSQNEYKAVINDYQNRVFAFFKKNAKKLST